MTVTFGSYVVPPRFETAARYLKFVVALAGGVAVFALALISAYAIVIPTLLSVILYGAVALATALGVAAVPNAQAAEAVADVKAILRDGQAALSAVEAGDVPGAVVNVKDLESHVTGAGGSVKLAWTEVKGVQEQTDRPAGPTS